MPDMQVSDVVRARYAGEGRDSCQICRRGKWFVPDLKVTKVVRARYASEGSGTCQICR